MNKNSLIETYLIKLKNEITKHSKFIDDFGPDIKRQINIIIANTLNLSINERLKTNNQYLIPFESNLDLEPNDFLNEFYITYLSKIPGIVNIKMIKQNFIKKNNIMIKNNNNIYYKMYLLKYYFDTGVDLLNIKEYIDYYSINNIIKTEIVNKSNIIKNIIECFDNDKNNAFLEQQNIFLIKYENLTNRYIGEEEKLFYFLLHLQSIEPTHIHEINYIALFETIKNYLVVEIDGINFILIKKFIEIFKKYKLYEILSWEPKNPLKINKFWTYTSNSELKALRLAAPSDNGKTWEKFQDYATQTLINFNLQKYIFQTENYYETFIEVKSALKYICNFFILPEKYEKDKYEEDEEEYEDIKLSTTQLFDKNDIMEINDKISSIIIDNRYYLDFLCKFDILGCGELFKKLNLESFIKKFNKSLSINNIYSKYRSSKQGKISISPDKLEDLKKLTNTLISEMEIYLNSPEIFIDIFYRFIGSCLNILIDTIESNEKIYDYIYEFPTDEHSNYNFYFYNNIYKMEIILDGIEYTMFYNKYNVETKCIKTCDFVNLPTYYDYSSKKPIDFYSIMKIIPSEYTKINKYGLDQAYTLLGILQCKQVEYFGQLTYLTNDDIVEFYHNNTDLLITLNYCFIGNYVNNMFETFTKFKDFIELNSTCEYKIQIENLKNKYIKYKNKYLNSITK